MKVVTENISKFTSTGLLTTDGTHFDNIDLVVFATGFLGFLLTDINNVATVIAVRISLLKY